MACGGFTDTTGGAEHEGPSLHAFLSHIAPLISRSYARLSASRVADPRASLRYPRTMHPWTTKDDSS